MSGLTPVQILEMNSLSNKLRDLEKRFEQLVASRRSEEDRQRQMAELQKQVELIQLRDGFRGYPESETCGVDPAERDEATSDIP